jgi:superfamily II DNA/RNA helicase
MSQRRIAVIGAGAAGLCAAKHLLAHGIDVVVYELGTRIGGLWVYENDNGLSGAYQSLHVNSENKVTAYKDFPFPESAPIYPDHTQMAQYLVDYAERFDLRRHIRFSSKVTSVEKLSEQLIAHGITAESIHGNKSHPQRQRSLKRFKEGHARVLVATDVAARGIHVDAVTHVINYDLPATYEDYIHRIGRTGRGKEQGKALTFVEA